MSLAVETQPVPLHADEHGVLRAHPSSDLVRVQDVGLRTQKDVKVLDWAAAERRVLLTHDAQTSGNQGSGSLVALAEVTID